MMIYLTAVVLMISPATAADVSLTVYNSDMAVVKILDSLDFKKGVQELSFTDVAKHADSMRPGGCEHRVGAILLSRHLWSNKPCATCHGREADEHACSDAATASLLFRERRHGRSSPSTGTSRLPGQPPDNLCRTDDTSSSPDCYLSSVRGPGGAS